MAGAVWNTWQFVVMRRFERDLSQWGLTLPMLPVHAQPSALSEESRRVVLQAIEQMMRHQAAQVLGYHHGDHAVAAWCSACASGSPTTPPVWWGRSKRARCPEPGTVR